MSGGLIGNVQVGPDCAVGFEQAGQQVQVRFAQCYVLLHIRAGFASGPVAVNDVAVLLNQGQQPRNGGCPQVGVVNNLG